MKVHWYNYFYYKISYKPWYRNKKYTKVWWLSMTGSSEMDTNKQTEESNNIPNNVGKSESSDSIEVIIIHIMICFYLKKIKI